jgi:hypothetical protein
MCGNGAVFARNSDVKPLINMMVEAILFDVIKLGIDLNKFIHILHI